MKISLIRKIILLAIITIIPSILSSGVNITAYKNKMLPQTQAGGTDWKAPKFTDKLTNPLAGDEKTIKEGKSLFTINCTSCHGDKGEGNGPAAISLNPKPKNLTSDVVQDQSDGAIFWKITTGKGSMVSWQNTFTAKQRWSLVNYIRQLKKNK